MPDRTPHQQLKVVLESLLERRPPRLLCGDLNAVPDDLAPLFEAAGLHLVVAGPTFPASAPVKQIDHVATDGLTLVTSSVPEVPVSDHRPLVVELSPGV